MRKKKSIETIEKMRNKVYTEEHKANISKSRIGELNPIWKGDKVGYAALHQRLTRTYGRPKNCDICHKQKPLDLANISGNYLVDIKDWYWLCRKCHMESDNRINNLKQSGKKYRENQKIEISKRVCNLCGKMNTRWIKDINGYICVACNGLIAYFRNKPIKGVVG